MSSPAGWLNCFKLMVKWHVTRKHVIYGGLCEGAMSITATEGTKSGRIHRCWPWCSCDWLNSLKPLSVTNTFPSTASLLPPLDQFSHSKDGAVCFSEASGHLTTTQCRDTQEVQRLVSSHHKNVEAFIEFLIKISKFLFGILCQCVLFVYNGICVVFGTSASFRMAAIGWKLLEA